MPQIAAAPTSTVESLPLHIDPTIIEPLPIGFSFLDLFLQADIIVKLVILILLSSSIISWAIIINKGILFIKLRTITNNFEKFFWSNKSLDFLLKATLQKNENHPLAQVFIAAMQEVDSGAQAPLNFFKERLDQSMRVIVNRSAEELENGVTFLATIASSSPFIGLFGTVWGIMSSFQSIAISKNTTLAVVAPGIAEALLATAFGLMVAIPAAIFYNKFSNNINKMINKIENFSLELSTLIMRDING